MKLFKKIAYSFWLSLLLLAGCQEPIELDLPPVEADLVVEGYLTQRDYYIPEEGLTCGDINLSKNDLELLVGIVDRFVNIDSIEAQTDYFPYNKVQLTTSADYFSKDEPQRVSGALVKLFENGTEVETLLEDSEEPGTYRITHQPEVGASYHLNIEALGNIYDTEPEVYGEVPPMLELSGIPGVALPSYSYRPNFLGDTCQFYLALTTYEKPGVGDHYRWFFYLNNEYIDDPFFINALDDQDFDGVCLPQQDFYGDVLEPGDTLVIFQMRTSESYFNFVNSIRNQTAFVGGPFDTPPAPIRGNINNLTTGKEAFGFFAAGGISALAVIVPEEIPNVECP